MEMPLKIPSIFLKVNDIINYPVIIFSLIFYFDYFMLIKNLYIYRMILNRLNKLKLLNILYTEKKFLFIITKLFF
jgi:hypothetical protein